MYDYSACLMQTHTKSSYAQLEMSKDNVALALKGTKNAVLPVGVEHPVSWMTLLKPKTMGQIANRNFELATVETDRSCHMHEPPKAPVLATFSLCDLADSEHKPCRSICSIKDTLCFEEQRHKTVRPELLALEDGEADEESRTIEDARPLHENKLVEEVRQSQEIQPQKEIELSTSRARPLTPQNLQCTTYRMDLGEVEQRQTRRESSLVRQYDTLGAAFCDISGDGDFPKTSETSNAFSHRQKESATNRENSLARSYDALDNFRAPAERPPLKGRTPTQSLKSKSRSVARHRAVLSAASAMGVEICSDAPTALQPPQIPSFSTPLAELRQASDMKTDVGPRQLGLRRAVASSPASSKSWSHRQGCLERAIPGAVELDLGESSFTRAAPASPASLHASKSAFLIRSSSKLPPICPPKKTASISGWKVPLARSASYTAVY